MDGMGFDKIFWKGGLESTSDPHRCPFRPHGMDRRDCTEASGRNVQTNKACCGVDRDGFKFDPCNAVERRCRVCLEMGRHNENAHAVTNVRAGTCDEHNKMGHQVAELAPMGQTRPSTYAALRAAVPVAPRAVSPYARIVSSEHVQSTRARAQAHDPRQTSAPIAQEATMVELSERHRRLFRGLGSEEKAVVFGVAYSYDDAQIKANLEKIAGYSGSSPERILRLLLVDFGVDQFLKESARRAVLGRMYLVYEEEIRNNVGETVVESERKAPPPDVEVRAVSPPAPKPKPVRQATVAPVRAKEAAPVIDLSGPDAVAARVCDAKQGTDTMPPVRAIYEAVAAMYNAGVKQEPIGIKFGQTMSAASVWTCRLLKLSQFSEEVWTHSVTGSLSINKLIVLSERPSAEWIEELDRLLAKPTVAATKERKPARQAKIVQATPTPEVPVSPDTTIPDELVAPPAPIAQPVVPTVLHVSAEIAMVLPATVTPWRVRAAGTSDTCSLPQLSILAVAPAIDQTRSGPPAYEYDAGDIGSCAREVRRQALKMAHEHLIATGKAKDGTLMPKQLADVAMDIAYSSDKLFLTFITKLPPDQKRALGLWTPEAIEAAE